MHVHEQRAAADDLQQLAGAGASTASAAATAITGHGARGATALPATREPDDGGAGDESTRGERRRLHGGGGAQGREHDRSSRLGRGRRKLSRGTLADRHGDRVYFLGVALMLREGRLVVPVGVLSVTVRTIDHDKRV